jgi:hypothetical protein
MSRTTVLLGALTGEPASTSELYDSVGYPALAGLGLIPYAAFRAELDRLSTAGLVQRGAGKDGSTTWRRPAADQSGPAAGSAER